jgi:hypothetical protein
MPDLIGHDFSGLQSGTLNANLLCFLLNFDLLLSCTILRFLDEETNTATYRSASPTSETYEPPAASVFVPSNLQRAIGGAFGTTSNPDICRAARARLLRTCQDGSKCVVAVRLDLGKERNKNPDSRLGTFSALML